MAATLGVSCARVTQVLRLLTPAAAIQGTIISLGGPLPQPIVTERMLRAILPLPKGHQETMIAAPIARAKQAAGCNKTLVDYTR